MSKLSTLPMLSGSKDRLAAAKAWCEARCTPTDVILSTTVRGIAGALFTAPGGEVSHGGVTFKTPAKVAGLASALPTRCR